MNWPSWTWADAAQRRAGRTVFAPSKAAERAYARQLKGVADEVTKALASAKSPGEAQRQLKRYAKTIEPWARQAAANMVGAAAKKNAQSWRAAAAKWGIDLKGLLEADITTAMAERIAENVKLISSIPLQAAEKVAAMAGEAVLSGGRADEIMNRLIKEGGVAQSRARVIALTEVSKAGTALTRARAESVGSEGYIWRTARDGATRPSHRAMEGRFVKWSEPPTLDGMTGHAGEFPNCRCYPEPVVHDSAGREVASPLPTREQEKASGEHKLRSQWERTDNNPVTPHVDGRPLPNVERARFLPEKLTAYAMDQDNPRGRDKARLWQGALGFDKRHAAEVERQIMDKLPGREAIRGDHDKYGERFVVVVPMEGRNGRVVDVKTVWMYKRDQKRGTVSSRPQLVTCYPTGR